MLLTPWHRRPMLLRRSPPASGGLRPAPLPTQLIAPGFTASPPAPRQQPQATQPETAEQIEARGEAATHESQVRLAKQELMSFVACKHALEKQIKLEHRLQPGRTGSLHP